MSLLSDAFFPGGSTRLHSSSAPKNGDRSIRKTKSHASGLLAPLVQLVRDPVATLNYAVTASRLHVPGPDTFGSPPDADAQRKQILYLRMKNAESFDEWKAAATELDVLEGNDAWKEEDESDEYDAGLVAQRTRELDEARISCDVRRMMFILRTALGRDVGGMGRMRLYRHSHVGTKRLIERYIESVQKLLVALVDVADKQGENCPIDFNTLAHQMRLTRQSFGRTALLLSGGGTFGMNHVGVVKCLWDQGLLPRLISGASAGSIVCAVLCTRTDEEIPDVMDEFCHGDLDVFAKQGEPDGLITKLRRMIEKGSLFDISHLARVMKGLLGDITFKEAYHRTRRILNIPVSTSAHFELPRLLNFVTAPDVIIWSAVCTSCSVPLIYKKATLLAKDPITRKPVPWDSNPDATFIDGSVDNDLPMTKLTELFTVNHFIVSQVNPHVVPFLAKEADNLPAEAQQPAAFSAAPNWLSGSLDMAREELVHRMQVLIDMSVFPTIVTKLRSVLSQRYSGDINIFPQISLVDLPRVLSNPTPEYMYSCMVTGQRATWPRLARIENHLKVEVAIDTALQALQARQHFGEVISISNRLARPVSEGFDVSDEPGSSARKSTKYASKTAPSSPVLLKSALWAPYASRSSLKTPPYASSSQGGPSRPNIAIESASAEESSDRDYFAEVDSDTTEQISSPSSLTSPSSHDPQFLPPMDLRMPTTPRLKRPHTPTPSTSLDRHHGLLLNLSMTSATTVGPSSPELRYKALFHPPGPVQPDEAGNAHASGEGRSFSRRGSLHEQSFTLVPEGSGTRGMLARKKSSTQLIPKAGGD